MDRKPKSCSEKLREATLVQWEKENFVQFICTQCDFYKPEKEKLECAAFKILVGLLKSGVVTVDQVQKSQRR